MKLGRKRPAQRCKLSLRKYCPDPSVLPTPPPSIDYSLKAKTCLGLLFLNDVLGCCVIAGGYHDVGLWTGNATGLAFCATDADIKADYGAIGGYVDGDPSTDNGCDEQTALAYWTQTGFRNGTKLGAYVGVDATNRLEVMTAVFCFETVFLGIELPVAWPIATGVTWDVAGPADPSRGHCVVVVGYNDVGVIVSTWGGLNVITWAALAMYCADTSGGEIYALLSPDEVSGANAPNGFDYETLQSDIAALPPAA